MTPKLRMFPDNFELREINFISIASILFKFNELGFSAGKDDTNSHISCVFINFFFFREKFRFVVRADLQILQVM